MSQTKLPEENNLQNYYKWLAQDNKPFRITLVEDETLQEPVSFFKPSPSSIGDFGASIMLQQVRPLQVANKAHTNGAHILADMLKGNFTRTTLQKAVHALAGPPEARHSLTADGSKVIRIKSGLKQLGYMMEYTDYCALIAFWSSCSKGLQKMKEGSGSTYQPKTLGAHKILGNIYTDFDTVIPATLYALKNGVKLRNYQGLLGITDPFVLSLGANAKPNVQFVAVVIFPDLYEALLEDFHGFNASADIFGQITKDNLSGHIVAGDHPPEHHPDEQPEDIQENAPEESEATPPMPSKDWAERKPRQTGKTASKPFFLAGMDADTLFEEVLTNPQGYFACDIEGPARISPEVYFLVREGARKPRGEAVERLARVVDLKDALTHSKLAVMEWSRFVSTVDARRHPAGRWLDALLGRRLAFDRANTVDITPDQLGDAPAIVAGLHRPSRDRLGVARLVLRDKVVRYTCAERAAKRAERKEREANRTTRPTGIRVKTKRKTADVLHPQTFRFAEFPMLAIFPAAWLSPVAEPWMAGLFGTPLDPALEQFCGKMPKEWYAELAKVVPTQDAAHAIINVRAMCP